MTRSSSLFCLNERQLPGYAASISDDKIWGAFLTGSSHW